MLHVQYPDAAKYDTDANLAQQLLDILNALQLLLLVTHHA
jgi:hypothetical protein